MEISIARTLFALAGLALAASVAAQPYPSRPVTIVNGFPPGGVTDTVLRPIASRLSDRLGQSVVIENRAGAADTIAAAAVARAEADGHTLLFGVAANLAVAPATMKSAPYDPARAFAPIVEVARGPYIWMVKPEVPAKGGATTYTAMLGGEIDAMFDGMPVLAECGFELVEKAVGIDLRASRQAGQQGGGCNGRGGEGYGAGVGHGHSSGESSQGTAMNGCLAVVEPWSPMVRSFLPRVFHDGHTGRS